MLDDRARERFWGKFERSDGCWLWRGTRSARGYGEFWIASKVKQRATRLMLELTGRPQPEGVVACHTCDNPACVRPDHLFWATQRQNILDMTAKGRGNFQQKETCKYGHPLDGRSKRSRYCLTCGRIDSARRYAAKKVARLQSQTAHLNSDNTSSR